MILLQVTVLIAIAILTNFLCKPIYREEDMERLYDESIDIVHRNKHLVTSSWIMSAVFSILILLAYNNYQIQATLMMGGLVIEILFLIIGLVYRKAYYIADNERFTYIKNRKECWSYKWSEIAHARRRIISTGKSFVILYEFTTTDGTKVNSLPQIVGKVLKKHVEIEKVNTKQALIRLAVALAFIILLFILIATI